MGRKATRLAQKFALTFAILTFGWSAGDFTSEARAAEASALTPFECLPEQIRLLFVDGNPSLLAQFDARVSKKIGNASVPEIEAELRSIVDEVKQQHPSFPRDEFVAWMEKTPLTKSEAEAIAASKASYGSLLEARYERFRLEKTGLIDAKKIAVELKAIGPNQNRITQAVKKKFPCLAAYPVHMTAMASSIAVQVAAYSVMVKNGGEFSWDLLFTNTIFNAILGEKICKEVEDMTASGIANENARRRYGVQPKLGVAESKVQYKNYFLGKLDPVTGRRPGFVRAMFSRQMKYVKYAVPYAGLYGVMHSLQGTVLHGKKVTFKPLSEIPEAERKDYVSLNPISLGKDAVVNMILYDIPFANQRNVFLMDPLLSIAIPNYLKKTVPIFLVQSGVRTASTYYSTEIFRCWEKDKTNIYGCVKKVVGGDPSVQAVIIPEEASLPESPDEEDLR